MLSRFILHVLNFREKKAAEEKRLEEERRQAEIAAERAKAQGMCTFLSSSLYLTC